MKNKYLFYYRHNQQKNKKVLTFLSESDIKNGVKVKWQESGERICPLSSFKSTKMRGY